MCYAVIIEKADDNYSAYVPDIPGCIATGSTVKETEREIREAIRFHLDGLRVDGLPIPEPNSRVEFVEVWKPRRLAAQGGPSFGYNPRGLGGGICDAILGEGPTSRGVVEVEGTRPSTVTRGMRVCGRLPGARCL